MAEAKRQLVVVVEGAAALGPYWCTILTDYIEKIARSFCASKVPGKKLVGEPPELALVVFHTNGPYNDFCVQRSGWTQDIDAFLSWLYGISFNGGGFSEAPICEGLAEALMGDLYGVNHGQPVRICKLEAYRRGTAVETLAADWPRTLEIVRLIDPEHMNKYYGRRQEFLVFRALNKHRFLGQLKERDWSVLLLSASDKVGRLIGLLLPEDMVVRKPPVSHHQPTMQQHQAPQQQLQEQRHQLQLEQQLLQQLQQELQHKHMQPQGLLLQQPQMQHHQQQQMPHPPGPPAAANATPSGSPSNSR